MAQVHTKKQSLVTSLRPTPIRLAHLMPACMFIIVLLTSVSLDGARTSICIYGGWLQALVCKRKAKEFQRILTMVAQVMVITIAPFPATRETTPHNSRILF